VGRAQGVDPGTGRGRLGSVGEGVLSIIRICLRAIPDKIEAVSRGQIVLLLGQLEMFRGDPILRVHIVRSMQGLDTEAYYRAICRLADFNHIFLVTFKEKVLTLVKYACFQ